MSESNWAALRQHFLAGYGRLSRQLARRLGSSDLAADVLHDIFLRIERGGDLPPVSNPAAYIQRMADNLSHNRRRRDSRLLTREEADVVFDQLIDEAPDPVRVAIGREDIRTIRKVLEALPARRREIFLAVWMDNNSHAEVAARMGLPLRRVQKESQAAREAIRQALQGGGEADDEAIYFTRRGGGRT